MYVAVAEKIASVVTLALIPEFFFREPERNIKENINVRFRNGKMIKFKISVSSP